MNFSPACEDFVEDLQAHEKQNKLKVSLANVFLLTESLASLFTVSDDEFSFSSPSLASIRNKNIGASAISSALSAHAGNLNGNVSIAKVCSVFSRSV